MESNLFKKRLISCNEIQKFIRFRKEKYYGIIVRCFSKIGYSQERF